MNMLRLTLCFALLASVYACGDDSDSPPPPPPPEDAGGTDSGGMVDSSTPPVDTGTPPGTCGGGACNLITGSGCPAGQGCYFGGAAGTAPMALCATSGTLGEGMACASSNECLEGYDCNQNVCRKLCCIGSDNGCPTGFRCSVQLVYEDPVTMETVQSGVGLCQPPDDCDPLMQTGCDAGETCYSMGGDGTTVCAMAGDTAEGGSCTNLNDCIAGHTCLSSPPEDPAVCFKYCDTMVAGGCMAGQTCAPLNLPAPLSTLGFCAPAATM